jgi:hypothetical protein
MDVEQGVKLIETFRAMREPEQGVSFSDVPTHNQVVPE